MMILIININIIIIIIIIMVILVTSILIIMISSVEIITTILPTLRLPPHCHLLHLRYLRPSRISLKWSVYQCDINFPQTL